MSDLESDPNEPVVIAVGPDAHASLAYAAAEAMSRGVALHLVRVVEPTVDPEELERLTTIGECRLHAAAAQVEAWTFGRQGTTRAIVEGSVARVLLVAARHACLVVIERPKESCDAGPSVCGTLATQGTTPFVVVPSGWTASTQRGPRPMRLGVDAADWPAAAPSVARASAPVLVVPTARRERDLVAL